MEKSSAPGSSFPDESNASDAPDRTPVGDADAAQKTTWVVGKGTNPNDRDQLGETERGTTPNGGEAQAMPRGTGDTPP